jgi:hypothetical protein
MLKGFTVPRSPLGTAALTPPPPWHYAGDVLAVEFWSDPEASADILPEDVKLDALSRVARRRSMRRSTEHCCESAYGHAATIFALFIDQTPCSAFCWNIAFPKLVRPKRRQRNMVTDS